MTPMEQHHAPGNGREHQGQPASTPQSRFVEDEDGATLDSGAAVCYFNARRGGRLQRWQWHTPPSAEFGIRNAEYDNRRPTTDGGSRTIQNPIDLVDPQHGALIDHFLPLGSKPEEFSAGEQTEYGDFADGPFRKQVVDSGGEIRIGLLRDGKIRAGKRVAEVRMAKSAALRPDAPDLAVLYRIINSGLRPLQILFAVEFNLFAPGLSRSGEGADRAYYLVDGER